jgi:hypothetical protein
MYENMTDSEIIHKFMGGDDHWLNDEEGAETRYNIEQSRLKNRKKIYPWIKHRAWWIVHNCVAHTLIGLVPFKVSFDFHDYTSKKMHEGV